MQNSGIFTQSCLTLLAAMLTITVVILYLYLNAKRRQELDAVKQRFSQLADSVSDMVLMLNLEGRVIEANQYSCSLLGYSREEFRGMSPLDFDRQFKVLTSFEESLYKEASRFETVYERRDGSDVPVEVSSSLLNHNGEPVYLVIAHDITDRITAGKELSEHMQMLKEAKGSQSRSLEELKRINRDLDDFTQIVSHDLKAPLRSIIGYGTLLNEDYADSLSDEARGYVGGMMDSSKRMSRLIDDLLTLSRVGREHAEYEQVDVGQVTEEIKLDIRAELNERGAEVKVGEMPVVYSQRVWVKQLFLNLMSNGLKFNRSEKPLVEVEYTERDDAHYFEVRDNGIGIAEEDIGELFTIFHRLHSDKEFPGTGTGLLICKRIVESLGGSIGVHSKPGEGSTFYFTLPKRKN